MDISPTTIAHYDDDHHREQVVALWRFVFGYDTAHNAPDLAIDKKLAVDDGLFFVALDDGAVIGTVMAGYDGHRGWIYSLAVHPERRGARHWLASTVARGRGVDLSWMCEDQSASVAGQRQRAGVL